jgi:gliding motility-associated-like protein
MFIKRRKFIFENFTFERFIFAKNFLAKISSTLLILFFTTFTTFTTFGQGLICSEAQEFCPSEAGDNISFSAGVNAPNAEPGNDYGCLGSEPNPAWYYIQVGQQGFINIDLFNSQNVDIDFALWGPFANLPTAYAECGSLGSPTDCSYSISAFETVNVPVSNPGDIYILLITNFSNQPTEITGAATGTGLAFCCSPPQGTGLTCADAPALDCSCWLGGVTGTLPANNVTDMPGGFCGSLENEQWIAFDACWCNATIEVTSENCTLGQGIEVQLFDDCDPFSSISDCITVADGATEFLTGNGSNVIECNVDSRYTLLLDGISGDICEYTIVVTPQPTPPPMILEDTIYGPNHVCYGDTVIYDFPPILNGGTCTATFTGMNTQVIDVTHTSFTVIYGDENGELCIQVSNCEFVIEFCMVVLVEDCENCNMPEMPGETCADAPLFCEIFQEDFCSHNDNFTPNIAGNLATEVTCPIDNNQWFQFVAEAEDVNFEFTATACLQYLGLEISILETADCENFTVHNNCTPVPYAMSAMVSASNLTIGQTYYVMIDGINGDECLWSLSIPTGVDLLCCPSFGGELVQNDFDICKNETVTIEHTGNMFLDDDDIGLYVLHDGTGMPFGNILAENTTGVFGLEIGMNLGQTYFIDYGVGDEIGGSLDINDQCFDLAINQNTVIFNSTTPELTTATITENCDALAETYTVTFELLNGTLPYMVNGIEITGSVFTSAPIATNTGASFEISSANECLAAIIQEVLFECPCDTDAGSIEVVIDAVCGNTPIQIIPSNDEILDGDDVLVFILKDPSDNIIQQNATGEFFFQVGMTYGAPYFVCAIAGNDDGTGNPVTDYPCFSSSDCIKVTYYGTLSITLSQIPEITCDFPESTIPSLIDGGTGDYAYAWSDANGVLSESAVLKTLLPGNYDLFVEDNQTGCSAMMTFTVDKAEEISGFDFTPTQPICFGENNGFLSVDTVFGGVAPFKYTLNGNVLTSSVDFAFLPTGMYDIMVKDMNGCELVIEYFLPEPVEPFIDLGGDITISLGCDVVINPMTNIDTTEIEFTVGNNLSQFAFDLTIRPLNETTVFAYIENENSCMAEDKINITVLKPNGIFAPNVFSPNNDGSNDFFYIQGDKSVQIIESFQVFDRWGGQIFEASDFLPNDTASGWDGTHKGKILDTGVYLFFAKIVFVDGREEVIKGDVALVR